MFTKSKQLRSQGKVTRKINIDLVWTQIIHSRFDAHISCNRPDSELHNKVRDQEPGNTYAGKQTQQKTRQRLTENSHTKSTERRRGERKHSCLKWMWLNTTHKHRRKSTVSYCVNKTQENSAALYCDTWLSVDGVSKRNINLMKIQWEVQLCALLLWNVPKDSRWPRLDPLTAWFWPAGCMFDTPTRGNVNAQVQNSSSSFFLPYTWTAWGSPHTDSPSANSRTPHAQNQTSYFICRLKFCFWFTPKR